MNLSVTPDLAHRRAYLWACELAERHNWARNLLITAGSCLWLTICLKLLLPLTFFDQGWAVCWPADGIVLAALLMNKRRYWLWIVLGFALSDIYLEIVTGDTLPEMLVILSSNVAEILISAFALPRFNHLAHWIRQPKLLARFAVCAVFLAPLITAAPIAGYYHHHDRLRFWDVVVRWGVSDALGMALWTPLILVLCSRETYRLFHWKLLPRTVGLLGSTGLLTWAVFHQNTYPLAFTILPALLGVALFLEFSGSVLAVNIVTILATNAAVHGSGPDMLIPAAHAQVRILILQIFLTMAMLMTFPISVILVERRNFQLRLEAAYREMERQAKQDGLTGVANRRHFDAALETEWRRASRDSHPIALLMLDADGFKRYNDLYGHLAGDDCLCRIAKGITPAAQRAGDLVARYGGEEFAVLLPGTDSAGAREMAEWIRFRVESLNIEHAGNPDRRVTVSVGCGAVIPSRELSPESLIEQVDQALYAAKRQGRNRVEASTPAAVLGRESPRYPSRG